MPLELRPNCEFCDRDLPANSADARICSYECTFCATCAEHELHDVCPNCGGNFSPRPIRPATPWRPGVSLSDQPAGTERHSLAYDESAVRDLSLRLRNVPPDER